MKTKKFQEVDGGNKERALLQKGFNFALKETREAKKVLRGYLIKIDSTIERTIEEKTLFADPKTFRVLKRIQQAKRWFGRHL